MVLKIKSKFTRDKTTHNLFQDSFVWLRIYPAHPKPDLSFCSVGKREIKPLISGWLAGGGAALLDVGRVRVKSVGNHVLSRSGAEVSRINDADIQLRIN